MWRCWIRSRNGRNRVRVEKKSRISKIGAENPNSLLQFGPAFGPLLDRNEDRNIAELEPKFWSDSVQDFGPPLDRISGPNGTRFAVLFSIVDVWFRWIGFDVGPRSRIM